jgi:hypothetical protein
MYIASTRFNEHTLEENRRYKETRKIEGCIYGAQMKIYEKYPLNSQMFVVEMNNETNRIEGIGLIKNIIVLDKNYKIYEEGEYNRYIYKGKYWLSRDQVARMNEDIVKIFDVILFKGKSNLKRMSGICVVTETLIQNWNKNRHISSSQIINKMIQRLKKMFQDSFEDIKI